MASYVDNGGAGSKKLVVTATSSGLGLIDVNEYATTTTADDTHKGDVKGFLIKQRLKNGDAGTLITLLDEILATDGDEWPEDLRARRGDRL